VTLSVEGVRLRLVATLVRLEGEYTSLEIGTKGGLKADTMNIKEELKGINKGTTKWEE